MNKRNKLKLISSLVILILVFGAGCAFLGTVDLRTTTAKTERDENKAKEILAQMARAHGIAQWDSIRAYTVSFEEEFLNFIGRQGNPFPQDKTKFNLSYIPNTFDGKMTFLNGKDKGESWGIQSWQTYTQSSDKAPVFKEDKNITFWLPTYQYFIEFPLRIQNANAFAYAGQQTIEGIACEGVMASWNTTEPQKHIDQYLIWVSKENHRIVKLEYTIRELYRFITGAALFKAYKNYNGLWLPSSLPVESSLSKDYIHEMKILDFAPNSIEPEMLRPNASIETIGDDKQ